jgi:hypothetical protein
LTQEWNSVVPSIEDIRKEAGGFSSDIGLAMELDFKGILGMINPNFGVTDGRRHSGG